jgi:hypothetical protein
MILKFDKPIDIREARLHYNDSVTFITSSETYPNISAIEFDGDPKLIFKRDALEPKVTKKVNKVITAYERKIARVWKHSLKEIKDALQGVSKAEGYKASDEQKANVHEAVAGLLVSMADAAEKPYYAAYETGKMRGQVISGQEIDTDTTPEDDTEIESLLSENAEYLTGFGNDINEDLDETLDQEYQTHDQLMEAIDNRATATLSRLKMYAAAIVGAVVLGTISALKAAKPAEGHRRITGGIWTVHPSEGKGGEVCDGCEENSGRWFTLDEFLDAYGNQNCLSRCRCDLRYGDQIIAPGDTVND